MTKTIELARQAKGTAYTNRHVEGTAFAFGPEGLERFAELVRADERARPTDEHIMEVARRHWKMPGRDVIDFVRELLA